MQLSGADLAARAMTHQGEVAWLAQMCLDGHGVSSELTMPLANLVVQRSLRKTNLKIDLKTQHRKS